MAELINIQGLFANVLETPEELARKNLEKNVGLFGNNRFAGMLGELRTNSQNNMRGFLQQAGSAVNENFDIRTPEQKFREVVNSIDPESETAEQEYIQAAKQFAPDKLPALLQNIRQRRIEDEKLGFQRDANTRAESAEGRAVTNDARLREAHTSAMAGQAQLQRIRQFEIEGLEDADESDAAKTDYLLNNSIVGQSPGYADKLAGMTRAERSDEFARVESIEGQVAKGARTAIEALLEPGHDMIPLLKDMPVSQLESIKAAIASGYITPSTEIRGDSRNGYKMVIIDPLNPTEPQIVDIISGTGPDPVERSVQSLTEATQDAIDAATGKVDMNFWWGSKGSVEDPNGNSVSGTDLVRQRAGEYYQLNKPTQLELTNLVGAAAAELGALEASDETYESLNRVLGKYFPVRQTAASLIDASLQNDRPS